MKTFTKIATILPYLFTIYSATVASATVTVNVNGSTYHITTIEGSFNANAVQLESQPWWGNQALTNQFVNAVKGDLGYPHVGSGNLSPFFAARNHGNPSYVYTSSWRESDQSNLQLLMNKNETTWYGSANPNTLTWAVTTPVPLPAAAWLFGSGIMGLVGMARLGKSATHATG